MQRSIRQPLLAYSVALLACIAMALLMKAGGASLQRAPSLLFIVSVVIASYYGGIGPGLVAGAVALFIINRYFSPPLEMGLDRLDLLRSVTFVSVATAVSSLGRARARALSALRAREQQQAAVARLGQQALAGEAFDALIGETVRLVSQTLGVTGSRVLEFRSEGEPPVIRAVAGDVNATGQDLSPVVDASPPRPDASPATASAGASAVPTLLVLEYGGRQAKRRAMGVPVRAAGRDWGQLTAEGRQRKFVDDDRHFLQAVANVLSTALDRRSAERALRESEARTRAILSTAADGIVTVDELGRVESANPAAERLFGYSAAELVGRSGEILLAEPFGYRYAAFLRLARRHSARVNRNGEPRDFAAVFPTSFPAMPSREIAGRRKNGDVFPMELAVSLVHLGDRILITGIARDATERKQLEREILAISDRERRQIGQDLHDGLGQHLAGISFMSSALRKKLAGRDLAEAGDADKIDQLVNQAIIQARTLSRGLYPVELQRGLGVALEELAANVRQVFGVASRCDCDTDVRVPEAIAAHLYRIAQEGVNNALKHSQAPQVVLSLSRHANDGTEPLLTLRIEDNGVGFSEPTDAHRGLGLRIMEYRSRIIGGTLRIQRGGAGGTIVSCSLPLP